MSDLPILERRRIEAQLMKRVYETITERSGEDEAKAVIGSAISKSAIDQGKEFADALGRPPTFHDMSEMMIHWTKNDALQIETLHLSDERMDFNVHRCRYSEMYKEMGIGHLGPYLSCNRDGDFCIGYNPKMKLVRTQTVMTGADYCDFRYSMEDTDAQS